MKFNWSMFDERRWETILKPTLKITRLQLIQANNLGVKTTKEYRTTLGNLQEHGSSKKIQRRHDAENEAAEEVRRRGVNHVESCTSDYVTHRLHYAYAGEQFGCEESVSFVREWCYQTLRVLVFVSVSYLLLVQQPEGVTLQKYPQTRLLMILVAEVV